MKLRRNKSKKDQAAETLGTYLKFKTAGKAAKGAKKTAKGTAQVAKRSPVFKRVPLIVAGAVAAGGAAAAGFVARKARGRGGEPAGA